MLTCTKSLRHNEHLGFVDWQKCKLLNVVSMPTCAKSLGYNQHSGVVQLIFRKCKLLNVVSRCRHAPNLWGTMIIQVFYNEFLESQMIK